MNQEQLLSLARELHKRKLWSESIDPMIEYLRNHRDSSLKPELEKAYALEPDQQEKGMIKAAILEIENPGKCVWTDEGRSEDGTCHYQCHDANKFWRPVKPKAGCAPVVDVPVETAQAPAVNAASPAPTKK